MGLKLASTLICFYVSFFLASLAAGVLARRGFLPLHMAALSGLGAYSFVLSSSTTGSPALGVVGALLTTGTASALAALLFLRVRGGGAALLCIAIQMGFEQYSRIASWTGGSKGLWRGIPETTPPGRLLLAVVFCAIFCLLYRAYLATSLPRLLVVDGTEPILYRASTRVRAVFPILAAGALSGLAAGASGVVFTLQMGFLAPSSFSLHYSLLYLSVILIFGYDRLTRLGLGVALFSSLPQILRWLGLGTVESSAWRGTLVGIAVLLLALLQLPRPAKNSAKRLIREEVAAE